MRGPIAPDRQEHARLTALRSLDILDTPPERAFDDIVALARALTGAETAVVSLIDEARQWFKARAGTDMIQTPREIAFCDHVVRGGAAVMVPDATRDPRFADNPMVVAAPHIRFYAGAPIVTPDGHVLGAVSVFDPQPRMAFEQAPALEALARQAAALLTIHHRAERRAVERASLSRELDRLWALAHDLILICDLDGVVSAANPAWREVFGALPPQGTVRMRDFLVDPADRPDLTAVMDGAAKSFTLDYRGADGRSRTITWTLRREGDQIYGIGRDDTALRAAERELVQAQKMEALGQLTGGIAHDFNNLLTIIIGNLDIAGRRLERGDLSRVTRALNEASEGATRAATLTQRLLAFARRQRLAPRAIAPATLLADMRSLIEHAAGDATILEMLVQEGVWAIEADAGQLENAIVNLAMNARDAMAGREARLSIAVGNDAVDGEAGRRNRAAPGDYVRITVADIGTGMAEETLARALEPFFTTKGVGRGTGLGLSQVEGFVRQSGGFVTIDSALDQGTAVHLWLPRSTDIPAEPALPTGTQSTAPRSPKVMVVEDNDGLRELVVETLRDAGYRVIEAHDGRAALSLFARQAEPPELVLSDVMMPILDGFQLAAEIRARAPMTRVLLMSGYTGAQTAAAPGETLLVKPFTTGALLDRVRQTIALPA
jgi:signal transduction histidine kinase/CheY-like chemotaxis protein